MGRIVDGLLPQKHAQLRATNFFSLTPGFPGFWVGSEELLQRIDVHLENGRYFFLRAHAAGECPQDSEGLLGWLQLRLAWLFIPEGGSRPSGTLCLAMP